MFIHHDRDDSDKNFPNHVGIVVDYNPEKDYVYTVEGNSGKAVRELVYTRDDPMIVGYASMRYCMLRWDDVYHDRLREDLAADMDRIKNRDRLLDPEYTASEAS